MTIETTYTDDRFPDLQLRWHGGATFNVWRFGPADWRETDCFTHYAAHSRSAAPPLATEAEAIARDWFVRQHDQLDAEGGAV